ncbi:MAG TPA: hypothetical protein VIP28_12575 [Nocardioides sp.]
MPVRPYTLYAASCDTCGSETEDGWGGSPGDAIANAADESGWTRVGDQLVCEKSDRAHDEARGCESPHLLRMGPDAMAVTFTA